MTDDVRGIPLISLTFDHHGTIEPGDEATLLAEVDATRATDVLFFAHGWNNSVDIANLLFHSFYRAVPPLLAAHTKPGRRLALVGVHWPSERWSDEPIPDFDTENLTGVTSFAAPPVPDAISRQVTRSVFGPAHQADVDELLDLLVARPDDSVALKRARVLIRSLAEAEPDDDDGERRGATSLLEIDDSQPDQLFADFVEQLDALGVVTDTEGLVAGFGDSTPRLWNGAQEVVRQLTYWQMKKRAGVIGQSGFGPLLARFHAQRPAIGLHLIGHSFGARLVAFALEAVPAGLIGSLTFLQGAFSHYAFAATLPFDPGGSGALAGLQAKVAGPVVSCYSSHDLAVGVFYPLASRAADEDNSLLPQVVSRWGGMGHDGHQRGIREVPLNPIGAPYDFRAGELVNIDASSIVEVGRPPAGAHSDPRYTSRHALPNLS